MVNRGLGKSFAQVGVVFLLNACGFGDLRPTTSGQIGCAAEDIVITEQNERSGTWTAECKGKRFYCGFGSEEHGQANCKEEIVEGAPVSSADAEDAAPGGCQYDAQCKGARICVEGECIEAPSPSGDSTEGSALGVPEETDSAQ